MDQMTFSEAEYQSKKRKTRREIFLERHGFGGAGYLGVMKRADHRHRKKPNGS